MSYLPHKRKKYESSRADSDSEINKVAKECSKLPSNNTDNKETQKRKNFIKAVYLVSQNAYFNYAERFQLVYMPICINKSYCSHVTTGRDSQIMRIPLFDKDLVKFEMETYNFYDALEICFLSITPTQYLSSVMLQDIFEILLNVHEDDLSKYTVRQVIEKGKLVLSIHFATHCPCLDTDIRKVYTRMLISPMDAKNNTYTTRSEFGSDKGIVQFCLNRLEYELSSDSLDGPLLDRCSAVPDALKQTIRGLFWQKNKLDIFEMLERPERIERLMVVMQSIIELLQFDIAIFEFNRGIEKTNRMKSNEKTTENSRNILMESILWRDNGCQKSTITNIFKQIMKIFCCFIHLEYPEEHIKTITLWLNIAIETFYIYNNNRPTSNPHDYPNVDKRFEELTIVFYKIFSDLPPKSIISILERIQPTYMKHKISHHHAQTLLCSYEADTMWLINNFYKNSQWNDYSQNNVIIKSIIKRVKPKKKPLLKTLSKICNSTNVNDNAYTVYQKFCPIINEGINDRNYIIYTLYITLKAYLEAYSIQKIQETLEKLNGKLIHASNLEVKDSSSIKTISHKSYHTSNKFIKKYRYIISSFQELIMTIKENISCREQPKMLCIFNRLLDFN